MMKKTILTILAACAMTVGANAQTVISDLDTNYVTNFTGWAGTLPNGYTMAGSGTTYQGSSASTTGGVYSVNGFNYQPSGSSDSLDLTGSWLNSTGAALTSLTISYDAFVVVDRASRTPGWSVTLISGSSSIALTDLSWISTNGTQTLSQTIDLESLGFTIAAGNSFSILWKSGRGGGSSSSPMIGLNDISVSASSAAVPEPSTYALLALGGVAFVVFLRRRKTIVN